MKKTIYKIQGINVKEFDRKTHNIVFTIRFSRNDVLDEFDHPWNLSNIPNLINSILIKVKQSDKVIVEADSDDFLDNIYITRIDNEDFIEERLLDWFRRLSEKIKGLKHERRPNVFMSAVADIKHQKLTL
jgi:hypothetical protein